MTFPYILLFFVTQQTDGSQCFLVFEHVLSRVSNVIDIMTITFFSKSVFHWQLFITYIFSVSLKFQACYITGQWGEFTVKNATLHVLILFWHFFLFLIKKLCFFRFHFFFLWSIKFPPQNINQSETETGDKKLSVQLYTKNQMKCFCLESMLWWE